MFDAISDFEDTLWRFGLLSEKEYLGNEFLDKLYKYWTFKHAEQKVVTYRRL